MASDLLGLLIKGLEGGVAILQVGFHHSNDLVHINVDVGGTDALAGFRNRNGHAVGQRVVAPNIGHAFEFFGLPGVDLNDDLLRCIQVLNVVANRGRRNEVAFLGNAHSLHDGNVHAAKEALLHVHAGLGQVVVRVEAGAVVDLVTHDRIGLVGGAEPNCIRLSQHTITVWSSGGTGEQVDHEFIALGVRLLRTFRDGGGQNLRVASTSKAGNADLIAMVDKLCGLVGRHHLRTELSVSNPIGHVFLLKHRLASCYDHAGDVTHRLPKQWHRTL